MYADRRVVEEQLFRPLLPELVPQISPRSLPMLLFCTALVLGLAGLFITSKVCVRRTYKITFNESLIKFCYIMEQIRPRGGGGGGASTTTLAQAGVPGSVDRTPDPGQS